MTKLNVFLLGNNSHVTEALYWSMYPSGLAPGDVFKQHSDALSLNMKT